MKAWECLQRVIDLNKRGKVEDKVLWHMLQSVEVNNGDTIEKGMMRRNGKLHTFNPSDVTIVRIKESRQKQLTPERLSKSLGRVATPTPETEE